MKYQTDRHAAGGGGEGGVQRRHGYRLEQDPRLPSREGARRASAAGPIRWPTIFDAEVVPMLEAAPGLRPVAIFEEMQRRHPELPRWRAPNPGAAYPRLAGLARRGARGDLPSGP